MATEHQLELLNDAHQTALRSAAAAVEGASLDTFRAMVRTTNVLLDRCIDCGMDPHEPDHEAWAAQRIARWLVEA
jgi:hypothetical protein